MPLRELNTCRWKRMKANVCTWIWCTIQSMCLLRYDFSLKNNERFLLANVTENDTCHCTYHLLTRPNSHLCSELQAYLLPRKLVYVKMRFLSHLKNNQRFLLANVIENDTCLCTYHLLTRPNSHPEPTFRRQRTTFRQTGWKSLTGRLVHTGLYNIFALFT